LSRLLDAKLHCVPGRVGKVESHLVMFGTVSGQFADLVSNFILDMFEL